MNASVTDHPVNLRAASTSMAVTMLWVGAALVALIMYAPPEANAVPGGGAYGEQVLDILHSSPVADGTVIAGIVR